MPQEALGGPRRLQEAPGRPRKPQESPGDPRRPKEAPGKHQEAPGVPRRASGRPQEAPGGPRKPQEAPGGLRRPPGSTRRAPGGRQEAPGGPKAFSQGTCSKKRGPKCELAKINHYKTAGKRPNRRHPGLRGGRPWGVEKSTLAGDLLQNTRSEEGLLKVVTPECARDPRVFVVFIHKNHTPPS